MEVKLMANILDKNSQFACQVKEKLAVHNVFALNMMGSPGSGKTSVLERTISALRNDIRMAVIEGDLFTSKDAERIDQYGVPVVQINTAGGCHLDANMVNNALGCLPLAELDMLIIENVGNLVCPAEFDVGEDQKAVVLSITEGEDKPLKYPLVFKESGVVILNKIDLLPYTGFNMAAAQKDILSINPQIMLIEASCRTGEGLDLWFDWLKKQIAKKKTKEFKG